MEIKTTLDNSVANYAKNLRDIAIELNYDKGSPDAKVSINQFEFIKKEAELLLAKVNGEGLGVFFGVPYKIELGEKGQFETLLDGVVDLTNAQKFSCREVIAPVIDKGGTDFLTQVADSFTFEYLFETRSDLLNKSNFKYVPYIRNRPDVSDLAPAVISLITTGITITQETSEIVRSIAGLSAFEWEQIFKILVKAIFVVYLILVVIETIQVILDMILCPVRYHAGMSALDLCSIGAAFKGYQFSSSILENDFKDLVIVPPKQEAFSSDDRLLFTGFQKPNEDEQLGFYQGTFGQLLRDLITMFNGKIIIEDSNGEGSQKIIRLERADFNQSNELYTLPDVDIDDAFTLNTNEFNASTLLRYATDDLDLNTYQFYELANVMEVLEPIDKGSLSEYTNLFSGYQETIIPFSMGVTREKVPPVEAIIQSLVVLLEVTLNTYIGNFNQLVGRWSQRLGLIDEINTIRQLASLNQLSTPTNSLVQLVTNGVDFSRFYVGRQNAFALERDQMSTHRVVLLDENFTINLNEQVEEVLSSISQDNDFAFDLAEMGRILNKTTQLGEVEQNIVKEDNNTTLSALNIYKEFHQINSFLPSDERPLGNQWKIIEANDVKFCKKDFDLLKNDNKFKDSDGNSCLLESLTWFPFQNKANFKFRINTQYLTNIQLKHGRFIQGTGR